MVELFSTRISILEGKGFQDFLFEEREKKG
jgi:hypothetical protein